jgi:hypothetical protein
MISRRAGLSVVMPALGAGIHVFLSCRAEGVDGRDKPGHDVVDEVHLIVMPALGAGIHVFLSCRAEGVDGPDKSGHDVIDEVHLIVMPALGAGIHVFLPAVPKAWMARTSPAMT